MPTSKLFLYFEVELSFECRLITYPLISWWKAYKDPT
jgi:hypothetical protein